MSNWGMPNGLGCDHAKDVGSLSPQGDGKWGQADLGGNIWEWALDYYIAIGGNVQLPLPCDDCANMVPGPGAYRDIRGGSYKTVPASMVRTGSRAPGQADYRAYENGIRCARPL